MSKSTPINQLPSNMLQTATAQQHIYNESLADNRQHAVQSFVMPQNTQALNDVPNEDDSTVMEALKHLGGGPAAKPPPSQVAQPQEYTPPPPTMQQLQMDPNTYVSSPMMAPGMFHETPTNQYFQSVQPSPIDDQMYQTNAMSDFIVLHSDLRNALIVIVVFVIISVIPVEKIIYKYIALDKVPYSHVVIKAVLAGILFFCLSKVVSTVVF